MHLTGLALCLRHLHSKGVDLALSTDQVCCLGLALHLVGQRLLSLHRAILGDYVLGLDLNGYF